MSGTLTVYFDSPFWVGHFEDECGGTIRFCRVVFGSEPTGPELLLFVRKEFRYLKFSSEYESEKRNERRISPKRLIRKIQEETKNKPLGTRSQEMMRLEREKKKTERKAAYKEERLEEEKRKRQLKAEKRKEKKKGH